MKASIQPENTQITMVNDVLASITRCFARMGTYWPLPHLIASNPLQGLEDIPFDEALNVAYQRYQGRDLPDFMHTVNRISIKWLQAYFDRGQASLSMPHRDEGLFYAWKLLAVYDHALHSSDPEIVKWITQLPNSAESAIVTMLTNHLTGCDDHESLFTFLTSSLPGWSAYIKYLNQHSSHNHFNLSRLPCEYLAFRLAITLILLPRDTPTDFYKIDEIPTQPVENNLAFIKEKESVYRAALLKKLVRHSICNQSTYDAQFVFCIDVRSESFRRTLEATGHYDTYGFAGFFGLPIEIHDHTSNSSYSSCPVLLKPKHEITRLKQANHWLSTLIKHLYQSMKFSLISPFALVECIGVYTGIWMFIKTFFHERVHHTPNNKHISTANEFHPDEIPLEAQCQYAESALRVMGLTENFSPKVILCGHTSSTENNAYASAYDCGACGGNRGAPNACLLANILNSPQVREHLSNVGIKIPTETRFIAAEHNTTTDAVVLFTHNDSEEIKHIQSDLHQAKIKNASWRLAKMENAAPTQPTKLAKKLSTDWSATRPEWGLAGNAAFIIAPRSLTRTINLDGRAFLHSYDAMNDADGSLLKSILTAPMVVAQWINAQYLFSSLDNAAFGGGSKITKNIVGHIGFTQGNASDLMHGLPLQSVNLSDSQVYHEPIRLTTVIYAPLNRILSIIASEPKLSQYAANEWVHFIGIDPHLQEAAMLEKDLTWRMLMQT